MNEARQAGDDFLRYLQACPLDAVGRDYEALCARAEQRLLGPDLEAGLLARLSQAIAARRPLSVIRIGDGEGNVLAMDLPDEGFAGLRGFAFRRILRSMFGRDDFAAADLDRLRADFAAAVLDADILGLTGPSQFARPYEEVPVQAARGEKIANVRGLLGKPDSVKGALRLFQTAGRTIPCLTDCMLHERLLPHYGDLLGGLDFLGLVTRCEGLDRALATAFGIGEVRSWIVPGQAKVVPDRRPTDHFPEVYDRLRGELVPPRPGAVFLVGAGILGKVYCSLIRARGGIAIDIGSVMDIWAGEATRRSHSPERLRQWALVPAGD